MVDPLNLSREDFFLLAFLKHLFNCGYQIISNEIYTESESIERKYRTQCLAMREYDGWARCYKKIQQTFCLSQATIVSLCGYYSLFAVFVELNRQTTVLMRVRVQRTDNRFINKRTKFMFTNINPNNAYF